MRAKEHRSNVHRRAMGACLSDSKRSPSPSFDSVRKLRRYLPLFDLSGLSFAARNRRSIPRPPCLLLSEPGDLHLFACGPACRDGQRQRYAMFLLRGPCLQNQVVRSRPGSRFFELDSGLLLPELGYSCLFLLAEYYTSHMLS